MIVLSLLLLSRAFAQDDDSDALGDDDSHTKTITLDKAEPMPDFAPENVPIIKGILKIGDVDFMDAMLHWDSVVVVFID